MNPKHIKVTGYTKQKDGTIKIDSKSYYEELAYDLVELEKPLQSSFVTLKKDVEEALRHITEDGSPKLVLTIDIKRGQPKITKRWVTLKKNYPRR